MVAVFPHAQTKKMGLSFFNAQIWQLLDVFVM